ncbi:MAG: ubiquinone/menaquinone biosynthesis methyltransferase [Actinomycetota bacterium]|nr:ubiquinone/menaquinone biosynthesis methyltransferase [Actinomycetota bacterium]
MKAFGTRAGGRWQPSRWRRADRGADDLPVGAAKTARVRQMFDTIAPRYDLVNRVMTFGLDRSWRATTVAALGLPPGTTVLDLACGTGDLSALLAARGHLVLGVDLSAGMLRASHAGAPLVQADSAALPLADGAVAGATCGYALRNFADLEGTFVELARVVRPGGRISLLDVAEPANPILAIGHGLWFRRAVPLLGGLLSDRAAYEYLPHSTAYLPPVRELRSMLLRSGFSTVNHRLLSGGLSQLLTATRVGRP